MGQYRVFVEKRPEFATEAEALRHDLNETLHLGLNKVRVINVYDLFNVSADELDIATTQVLSEVVTDVVSSELQLTEKDNVFAIEYLPGQFDQRADSAMQCLSLLCGNDKAVIKSGKVYILEAPQKLDNDKLQEIKNYLINPVESHEKDLGAPLELVAAPTPEPVPVFQGFRELNSKQLEEFLKEHGMAMSLADISMIQEYFQNQEKRDPTETELRVLDTYWSDHCRHTTFETVLKDIKFEKGRFQDLLQKAFDDYLVARARVYADRPLDKIKPMTLMDLATIAAKDQRKLGLLDDQEISDEINACSIYVNVDVDGATEPWLLMFKNETHNHPTEIEPFGGASTCIGGAIRDPLSGRSYVYQAMRLSGVSDIIEPIEKTISGKLPQKVIARGAAHGNSSYGNQIGLATSFVKEIFHPGYQAKHLEVGAVVGAVPASYVKRLQPTAGDVVLLLGGATGRDGIGGATGSSKVHTEESVESASSEVQKGNAPMERRIQRLFRNPQVTELIKKCNDFGAGGVCVAIGELADGLDIDLDAVPVKYDGLNGTELAISESQERMAVLVSPQDVAAFQELAAAENLDAVVVAHVTGDNRLTMEWRGDKIASLSRDFLNTNGAKQEADIVVKTNLANSPLANPVIPAGANFTEQFLNNLKRPNVASRQGMVEMFDSTVGAGTVFMPYGGKFQLTEAEGSAHKLPLRHGITDTASILTYGYDPELSSWSPFHGALYAVIDSIAKVVAMGGDWHGIRFSFQEYFQRLGFDPEKWGAPFSALLGALTAQQEFGLPAIGGKDSMSGTFQDMHVPPTLISFAVQTAPASQLISPEFKRAGQYVYLVTAGLSDDLVPDFEQLKANFSFIYDEIAAGNIMAASTVKSWGIAEALAKMSFGNKIGVVVPDVSGLELFNPIPGALIVASEKPLEFEQARLLGNTTAEPTIDIENNTIDIEPAIKTWQSQYEHIYPVIAPPSVEPVETTATPRFVGAPSKPRGVLLKAQPHVYLPTFPGTNCEYDSARAFEHAGATTTIDVFRNRNASDVQHSISSMAEQIVKSQILMLSGGFSAGDEPDGSGKFIAAVLQNAEIRAAVEDLLNRGGLILGICNGFQALIKVGLLPYGEFGKVTTESPTLFKNDINRHISKIIQTRIANNNSPWLAHTNIGDIHNVVVSHGEGKFVANENMLNHLAATGQIATQYVDPEGNPTMNPQYNPNGSAWAIEGITSPDGRIFGKMGHSERIGPNLYKNVLGNYNQRLFQSGVEYFKNN